MEWSLREFTPADYPAVSALWRASEGVGQGPGDSEQGVRRFLARNPGLSFVAVDRSEIIGAILGGHDGRRGFIYHLAVTKAHRRQGIATALTHRCLASLRDEGLERCQVFVFHENAPALDFWRRMQGRLRSELAMFSIPLA